MEKPTTISCEEALRRLAEFVDRELAELQQEEMERHLHTCQSCYSRMEFERRLKEQLSRLSPEEAPAGTTDRIRALIKDFK